MRYCLLLTLILLGCKGEKEKRPTIAGQEASSDAEAQPTVSADLPNKGVSKLTSIEATVRGTATDYKYAFLSSISPDCAGANYGTFQSIDTKLKIPDLGVDGPKTVCIIGKNSTGTESQTPAVYQWMKQSDDPGMEQDSVPTVTVQDIQEEYSEDSIVLTISATNGATHYQYTLKQGDLDCQEDDEYEEERAVGTDAGTFTLTEVSDNGDYTLCLLGKNNVKTQDEASRYTFEKIDPPPPESAGMLNVTTSHPRKTTSLYFASASKSFGKITLNNESEGDLQWKIETDEPASWLKIGTIKNNLRDVVASDNLVSGMLGAEEETTIFLRLADIYKTDYEVGKKTVILKVHNVSSDDQPVSIDVNMVVPRVEVAISPTSPGKKTMTLNVANPKGKVELPNKADGNWAVKYQLNKFIRPPEHSRDIVSYHQLKTSDGKHLKYIEFSVNMSKLANKPDNYRSTMSYQLITNTSSKGVDSICFGKMIGGQRTTIGIDVRLTPKFTTNVCHYVWITVTK